MSELALGILSAVLLGLAYAGGRLHQWILQVEEERHARRMPNWLVAGIEDAQAVNIDTLLRVREVLMVLESRLATANRILGETRSGAYDPEQPAHREDGGKRG